MITLDSEAFKSFGLREFVYLRPLIADKIPFIGIFSAEGKLLARAETAIKAAAMATEKNLKVFQLH